MTFWTKLKIFISGNAGYSIDNAIYKYKYSNILSIINDFIAYFIMFFGGWSLLLGKVVFPDYFFGLLITFVSLNLVVFLFVDIVTTENEVKQDQDK